MMLVRTLVMSAVMSVATAAPGLAQTEDITPPAEKCRVAPQPNGAQKNEDEGRRDSLTEKLDPCDGVLKPPAVGDQEMTQPAPQTDNMPVVKPHDLPGQQPGPEQK
jgi:hypothetical protein